MTNPKLIEKVTAMQDKQNAQYNNAKDKLSYIEGQLSMISYIVKELEIEEPEDSKVSNLETEYTLYIGDGIPKHNTYKDIVTEKHVVVFQRTTNQVYKLGAAKDNAKRFKTFMTKNLSCGFMDELRKLLIKEDF